MRSKSSATLRAETLPNKKIWETKTVKAVIYLSIVCALGVGWATPALSQADSSLDEVVVTAKSLEEELPQQLTQYGTHLDVISAAQIQNGG